MRIGVVGGGVVGHATARCYMEYAEVRVYDHVNERCTHSLKDTLDSDLVMVCLPTPQKEGSLECDLKALDGLFDFISADEEWGAGIYVLKSTVPIGTTRRMCEKYNLPGLIHSPEFLTARCAVADAQMPARNIIGIPTTYDKPANSLRKIYELRFPGVPVYVMTSDESEAVKLVQNSYFALKVAFWNEARTLCDKLGLEWHTVLNAILADGRVDPSHTQVPGPDGKRGYGGTCLPKDIASLIHTMKGAGLTPHVTEAALARNKTDREAT